MKCGAAIRRAPQAPLGRGSVLVIVLWIVFGLVTITLYFAHSMNFELRAADNRVAGLEAEHAIAGAARYVSYVLSSYATNGAIPDPTLYASEAVPVGEAHFWLIGRDTNAAVGPGELCFGLVDEASKLNLNTARSNMLVNLSPTSLDLTSAILDWRDTNGGSGTYETYYAMQHPAYQQKSAPFETVDELRLLCNADLESLEGEDLNRNGVLDPNEPDLDSNGQLNPGILDCVTVYSREPNTYSNGVPRVNIRTVTATGPLPTLLQSTFGSSRSEAILAGLGLTSTANRSASAAPGRAPAGRAPAPRPAAATVSFSSPLAFYIRCHQAPISMTPEEFAQIANALTVASGTNFIEGRVNVNTASATVLACLPGISDSPDLAQTLVDYRSMNGDKLTSVAWLVDALGQTDNNTLAALAAVDCLTTQSFQFSADIAAIGHFGRGYRRVKFVFDVSDGTPKIIYRQDLSHLGWALGKDVRTTWLMANISQ